MWARSYPKYDGSKREWRLDGGTVQNSVVRAVQRRRPSEARTRALVAP